MWLYGTARRVLSNRHRSEIRLSRLTDKLSGVALGVVADHSETDDSSDLAAAVEALNALKADDREILLLVIWEELTPAQVAAVFDRSTTWVSVRLHRAKGRLRKEFLQQMKEPSTGGHVLDRKAHGDVAPEKTP
jgi:RNA polymerase sigma-70 factor (ECF subfamily)